MAEMSQKDTAAMAATIDFIREVLSLGSMFEGEEYTNAWENVCWRTDGEYAPVTFFVNCNDLFFWGCADVEEITPENVGELRRAVSDLRESLGVSSMPNPATESDKWKEWDKAPSWGTELFACRVRKMRPQTPVLNKLRSELRPLFEACGPERHGA